MSQPGEFDGGMDVPVPEAAGRPPRHGFQGDRGARPPAREVPQGLTVAVSRETGARGGSIARLAGAPKVQGAGVDLACKLGDTVRAGTLLYRVYAGFGADLAFARQACERATGYRLGTAAEVPRVFVEF